ncbi:hypothetical protein LA303_02110 [Candidatus Sulfidibacterium hydrothermale]|uniref:hypothetical protein n=1 Tax=Candidatus Sulfidibacterium hydrothermale TaxID=2875962 RepID=UPI001F0AC87D|nr:hypothetical protein [Candidatus Sulfidibacterium hydrothermale]UBM62785.1 hypothetical protein LA303_02110 [Candidatus Sulfidibacterium hydrothermale]
MVKISIQPDMGNIYKFFPCFLNAIEYIREKTNDDEANKFQAKMARSWGQIDSSEYEFLSKLFTSRKIKVSLDDVGYIYNYLKFIYRVKNSTFNDENEELDKSLKELWSFFQIMEKQKEIIRISIQTKDYETIKTQTEEKIIETTKNIRLKSKKSLDFFDEIFRYSIKHLSGMVYTKNYLLAMQYYGYLDSILKKRPGNKIDYAGTVLIQAVTSFKNYLNDKMVVEEESKHKSKYTIIGEILEHIGFIKSYFEQENYMSPAEYHLNKAKNSDYDEVRTTRAKIEEERFIPEYFILLNNSLI